MVATHTCEIMRLTAPFRVMLGYARSEMYDGSSITVLAVLAKP